MWPRDAFRLKGKPAAIQTAEASYMHDVCANVSCSFAPNESVAGEGCRTQGEVQRTQ